MPAFQWTYIICCLIQLATSQSVDQFTISTTAAHPGDDATNLEVTLYWGNNSYNCSFPTSTTTQAEYNCNDQAPWSPVEISQDYTLPYYLQFKWMTGGDVATSFIEIDAINVTLDNGFWYAIDHFCIHSMMSCTSGLSSTQKCGQWSSKDEYNTFKMGSTTNFQLLYVDFRSNITGIPNFANIIHEGSVRPPNLVQLGLTTQQTYDADAVSAQWDNKYYRCTGGMTFTDSVGNWTCDITESKTCPGVNSSFWWSIHNDATGVAETITVTGVQVTDETGTTYRMSQWCHPLEDPFYTNAYSNCTELTPYIHYTDPIPVGGMFVDVSQVAFIAPDYAQQFSCLFAYPDVYEPNIDIAVLSADGGMKGWGHDKYGGTTDIVCPITPGPTTYPTTSPTFEPTSEPTWEPTFEPTFVPTSNPTFHPTADPTFEPTVQPTHDPTNDPTSEPTQQPTYEPTTNPTDQPTHNPTADPTYEPTTNPTFDPTSEPSYEPTNHPTSHPSSDPTLDPTYEPTYEPTTYPTTDPTADPTSDPTHNPTSEPTYEPTTNPTYYPSSEPTFDPTSEPTYEPTNYPTSDPTFEPTHNPTSHPTFEPTNYPTTDPTVDPTSDPTFEPTNNPTTHPTADPSADPTFHPTFYPTYNPTGEPTLDPTATTENVVDDRFILPYNIQWIEGIIAIVALLICCLLFGICCWCYRRKLKAEKEKVKTLGGNITAGTEMTETTKTTIVLNTAEEEQKDNEHGFEAVQAESPDVELADVVDIKLEDSDEIKLEQAWTEGGEGGKSIDTINTMNTGDFVGSLDGVRDTGNKDDAALDLILDGAPTQHQHRESVKFTV